MKRSIAWAVVFVVWVVILMSGAAQASKLTITVNGATVVVEIPDQPQTAQLMEGKKSQPGFFSKTLRKVTRAAAVVKDGAEAGVDATMTVGQSLYYRGKAKYEAWSSPPIKNWKVQP